MKNKYKDGWMSLIIFILLLIIGLFFFFKSYNKEKNILNDGIQVTATVYRHFKGTNVRGGKIWISEAVYVVEEKKYKFIIEAKLPIGKTIKLKYFAENPGYAVLIDHDELKNYPKTWK